MLKSGSYFNKNKLSNNHGHLSNPSAKQPRGLKFKNWSFIVSSLIFYRAKYPMYTL